MASFDVYVSKDTFKFNAAHFVAFDGYRERLHGHNYRVGIRLLGKSTIGRDGYVIDFGCIKDVCKRVCKRMNEHFLVPMHSDVLTITEEGEQGESIRIVCQDQSVFVFPRSDCLMLPIVHATTEEIAIYLWSELLEGFNCEYLTQRGIHSMEVTVAEAPGQEATFRLGIIEGLRGGNTKLDVRSFITEGSLIPMPCLKGSDKDHPNVCQRCHQPMT